MLGKRTDFLLVGLCFFTTTLAAEGPIYCPKIADISAVVMEGTATAPGGWHGKSAVPLDFSAGVKS